MPGWGTERQANARHKGTRNLGLGDHLVDSLGHRGKARSVNDGRRGHAGLGKQVSVLIEQTLLDRGAADVDADVILLRFHGSPPFSFKHCLYGTAPKAKTYQKGQVCFGRFYLGKRRVRDSVRWVLYRFGPVLGPIISQHDTTQMFNLKRSNFSSGATFNFIFLELFNNSIEILRC